MTQSWTLPLCSWRLTLGMEDLRQVVRVMFQKLHRNRFRRSLQLNHHWNIIARNLQVMHIMGCGMLPENMAFMNCMASPLTPIHSHELDMWYFQVTWESISGTASHVCCVWTCNGIDGSYDKIIITTRNNTDGNKLVIFSSIAFYYHRIGSITTDHSI